jgi:hypothetical protein
VIDVTGQEMMTVASKTLTAGTLRQMVDVSTLAPGIYFLMTEINGVTTARKFMVSR